jgi:hypothetical protein
MPGKFWPAPQFIWSIAQRRRAPRGVFVPDITPPAAPTGLVATAGLEQVSLNWNDNTELDLAGYNIYRDFVSPPAVVTPIATVGASDYIDLAVSDGITYYYVVKAFDASANESSASNEANATPYAAPPPPPPPPYSPPLPVDRFAIYKVEVAWSSVLKGVFVVDVSTVGGSDLLGGNTYNSPFGGPYDDLTRRDDNHVRVKTIQWARGRSDDLATVQALTGTITVSDPDGMMNNHNPASPLNIGSITNGSIRPLRPVRVSAYFNGVWTPILFGFLRTVDFEPEGRTGTATLEITDLFTFLETPRQDQPGAAPYPTIAYTTVDALGAPMTTGGAIGMILDYIGWKDTSLRRLDVGDAIPFLEATGNKTALAIIQELLAPNLGIFYINHAGVAVYEHRLTKLTTPVSFAITNKMTALGAGTTIDRIKNKWTVTRQSRTGVGQYADQTPQVSSDATSGNEFGERADTLVSQYLVTDAQALALSGQLVTLTKDPVAPLWNLSMENRDVEMMTAMLTIDIHDKIAVSEAETGTAGVFFVEQVSGTIDADGHKHRVQLVLNDQDASFDPFIVGTDTVGGTKTLAF